MSGILIEPHYLGSLEYFTRILYAESIHLEIHQNFTKQTFKNRCVLLTTNGVQSLSIPVQFDQRTAYKDVKIDHDQSWLKEHWGSFFSAYGKSPFYEYFSEQFRSIWFSRQKYLLDLSLEMMTLCLQLLQIDRSIQMTSTFELEGNQSLFDFRELIVPKSSYDCREFYRLHQYSQVFGNKFVPNLSIVDLIMNEGSNARQVLIKSSRSSS